MELNAEKLLEKVFLKMMKAIEAKPIIPIEYQVWDLEDIGHYLDYTPDYVKRYIITQPHFPPSRDLPTKEGHTVQRWRAKDVIDYAMAFDKSQTNYC